MFLFHALTLFFVHMTCPFIFLCMYNTITIPTVKLVNQGLEAIEVSDNGSGVPSSSRPMMGMKHATSKLRQFDDLYSDQTTNHGGKQYGEDGDNHAANEETNKDYHSNDYDCAPTLGFRGEALFCLSNISRSLSVSTKSTDDKGLGEAFSFDQQGQLISNSIKKVPRPVGTTVTVHGLFEALPVRRVDLCKRIKGQRTKLMKMMQGCKCTYISISIIGIQFICLHL